MTYFFIDLALHALVSLGILLLLLRSIEQNRSRKTKRGVYFFLPVVLSVLLLLQAAFFTIPRMVDTVYVVKSNYMTIQGEAEQVSFLKNTVQINGHTYYLNPFLYKPENGDILKISYTPYSRYAAEIVPASID